jgi:hypothetical protein
MGHARLSSSKWLSLVPPANDTVTGRDSAVLANPTVPGRGEGAGLELEGNVVARRRLDVEDDGGGGAASMSGCPPRGRAAVGI